MNKISKYLIGLSIVLTGCGGSTPSDPVADGWAFFSSGQFTDAHASFVMGVEQGNREGYVGLGWICIDLDSIPEADRYFGLAAGDSLIDGFAGWSAVLSARGNYSGSILKADFVLRHDPSYTFIHRPTVNFQDMIWYQASAYLQMGNYAACLERIQELDSGFTTNVNAADAGDVLAVKLELLAGQLIQL